MASLLVNYLLLVLAWCEIAKRADGKSTLLQTGPKTSTKNIFISEPIKGTNLSLRRRLIELLPVAQENWNKSTQWPVGINFVAEPVNGEVLVWGGQEAYDRGGDLLPRNVIYFYDPDTNTWRKIAAYGDILNSLSDTSSSTYHEGFVYIFAGIRDETEDGERPRPDPSFSSIFSVNVITGEFRLLPVYGKRPTWRYGAYLWSFQGGLYIFGGQYEKGMPPPDGIEWNDLQPPEMIGDNDNLLARFDLSTYTWTAIQTFGPRPSPRCDYAMAMIGDQVFVNGGHQGPDGLTDGLNDMYKLDMNTLTWTALRGNGVENFGHTLSPISNDRLLMVPGAQSNKVWVFDTSRLTWEEKAPIPYWYMYRRVVMKKKNDSSVICLGGTTGDGSHIGPGGDHVGPGAPLVDHMLVFDIV